MNDKDLLLKGIGEEINSTLFEYVKIKSFSNSFGERDVENFFRRYFSNSSYFKEYSENVGVYPIKDDMFNRHVCYALVKGKGSKTIVMIHHYDVVTVEDFKRLKNYAFSPDALEFELQKIKHRFNDEVLKDLVSKEWIYGRGVCDMKGGGAIQMALLKRYSELENFEGNLIVIGVPDEENLSSGMRGAVKLLKEFKDKYNLDYKLMINSEPHQRNKPTEGVFSFGSVGKLMPFVYVRGYLSHAGRAFEGLNPINIMGEIVRKTELNMEFSDVVGYEVAPPPTWLYVKDGKEQYDVSIPLVAKGCISVLVFKQTPKELMIKMESICKGAFETVIDSMNSNYRLFCEAKGEDQKALTWKAKVISFGELYKIALKDYHDIFKNNFVEKIKDLNFRLRHNEINFIDSNFELVDFVYEYIDSVEPCIVYGLIPPYYPSVSNLFRSELEDSIFNLEKELTYFVKSKFDQTYKNENFYIGISDLSYSALEDSVEIRDILTETMPLFGEIYNIPLEIIEEISMPCINIGPWGKDLHQLTERVYKEDLYIRTPSILVEAIELILASEIVK